MKKLIKSKFPLLFDGIRKIYLKNKKVVNYFNTKHTKNALLSYITYPFTKGQSLSHTNYYEALSHARILNELGFNVDIVDYDYSGKIDFKKYEVLVGFGEPFVSYFKSGFTHIKTINYGTGMENTYTNYISLKRIKEVYLTKKVWLFDSARYIEKTWMPGTILVDAILALGNNVCVESYAKYYDGIIYSIPGLFYKTQNAYGILKDSDVKIVKNNYLWFGSSGLVRKGLDLVLEVFAKHPELKLHICGPIKNEPDFEKLYFKELFQTHNIINHNFVDISSRLFKEILHDCAFVIFPSCMEGGSPSTLTAVGNGALIPIVTKETTISTGFEIWINEISVEGVEKALRKAMELTEDKIVELRRRNLEYVLNHHSQENYYKELKKAICEILGVKNAM
jgi:hypothetical protein